MAKEKIIPLENLEAICKVLGEQNTGTDIGLFLNIAGIDDSDNLNTKWKRLFNAFYNYQTQNNESNRIQIFIQKILKREKNQKIFFNIQLTKNLRIVRGKQLLEELILF